MKTWSWGVVGALVLCAAPVQGQQESWGSVRGVVLDADFDAPLPAASVMNVELEQRVETTDQGNFVFSQVPPGQYTLIFAKDGYVRQVRTEVVVAAGRLTELQVALAGDFTDMEEFVVHDALNLSIGSEAALLQLRIDSPALIDSIGSDLMSRAGASDAAGALKLVSGATVQDGKFAVIRGLPDRYVSSQLNGVRMPSADEEKRAVELDQFPSAVIESIQVSKTFTPDQQGDASGGAVDVRLKGVPDETILEFNVEVRGNTNVMGSDDFLSYEDGGVGAFGLDDGGRSVQSEKLGSSWDGAVGVSEDDAPLDWKWSGAVGGKRELDNGLTVGGFLSVFYDRDSSGFDDGVSDAYWVENPGDPLTPEYNQGTPADGDFKTSLFDVEQGSQSVQWGGLASFGVESENHFLGLSYLFSHSAEDTATLAIDRRGKEYYFPGYDPTDPTGTGNDPNSLNSAPYLRLETLEYTERTTGSLQLRGEHTLSMDDYELAEGLTFSDPVLDWVVSSSTARLTQPDKRQFGALWLPPSFNPGVPPFVPPSTSAAEWFPYKPGANFNLGNLQRVWKDIEEDSLQLSTNLELPFEQWTGDEGYLKFGLFDDSVGRTFDQDTYSNFNDNSSFVGSFNTPWSGVFPGENHPISASEFDVDYDGTLDVSATYAMLDLPLASEWTLIGGFRFEKTGIDIEVKPDANATWIPPGATAPVSFAADPDAADVDFSQEDVLPSLGLVYEPAEEWTLRGSYSQTIARQTFRELTPVIQQEFLGAPIFIGNPELQMSDVENWDLRVDYRPVEGSLFSVSWFDKNIEDAIEYVQQVVSFTYTTAVNYPRGDLTGFELEARQDLGRFWEGAEGLSLGANATFLDGRVQLPKEEIQAFNQPNIAAPMSSRDMTNTPDHLYNLYLTYDLERTGTRFGLFYTVKGDTLVAGAGESTGNFVPSVYASEVNTLNFSVLQRLGEHFNLKLQAKNLTNPNIETVYRSDYTGSDVVKTSYTTGIDLSLSIGARFSF